MAILNIKTDGNDSPMLDPGAGGVVSVDANGRPFITQGLVAPAVVGTSDPTAIAVEGTMGWNKTAKSLWIYESGAWYKLIGCLVFWLSIWSLHSQTISRNFATTNGPTTLTNIVRDLAGLTNGVAAYVRTNAAPFDTVTTDFVVNTYYTNTARRAWVGASFTLTGAATGTAAVGLYVDQAASGTFANLGPTVSAGPLAALVGIQQLGSFVSPNARFVFTNLTSGSGATAAIVTGTSQYVNQ